MTNTNQVDNHLALVSVPTILFFCPIKFALSEQVETHVTEFVPASKVFYSTDMREA